jgi:SAM-dependent methyltransferase
VATIEIFGMSKWYESWFDSPYYHILYNNRNHKEAAHFINKLCDFLPLNADDQVVDMACGKGRHARIFADKRYDTIGLDLSPESIAEAKKYEKCNLHFFEHNMLNSPAGVFQNAHLVCNLFTSFGYFDTLERHEMVIKNFAQCIRSKGYFVFDFMNAHLVKNNIIEKEEIVKEGIHFKISRSVEGAKIKKNISFNDQGHQFDFQEEVFGLELLDFKKMFESNDLEIVQTFGDYDLNPFDLQSSTRLILIAQKR